jgi:hypothetical protein
VIPGPDEPSIDTLLLADWAEAIDGKLYVMGGGFTTVVLPSFERAHRFALAAILRIPRRLQGRPIPVSGRLETAEGEELDSWSLDGEITAAGGEPAERDGTAVVAGPVELRVDGPGDLVLKLRFGQDERAVPFTALGPPG